MLRMSTIDNSQKQWQNVSDNALKTKYEKCRNITEEIYKRIDITFAIKKLETDAQSDETNELSDQIDSNDLSNETDLFAYEKSDSISSSISEEEKSGKIININNNVEHSKTQKCIPKLPKLKKKYRKRVKKKHVNTNKSDTDCSSDESVPLSRIVVDMNATKSDKLGTSPEWSNSSSPKDILNEKLKNDKIVKVTSIRSESEKPKTSVEDGTDVIASYKLTARKED